MTAPRLGPTKTQTMKLPIWASFCLVLAAFPAKSATQNFATDFDGSESPLSESGAWSNSGLDWTNVIKSNGVAFGTQSGTNGYDDSYAVLSGFSPNQAVSATVQLASQIDSSCSHEMELLLRWSDAAHSAKGYECNLSFDGGYAQIVRWNGAIGDFTVLGGGSFPGLKSGDVFRASINGSQITVSVNGVNVVSVTDNTYTAGNPGIGFFRRACGSNTDVGFTSFSAIGSDASLDTVPPAAPTNLHVL
jgi:hypothetical protein